MPHLAQFATRRLAKSAAHHTRHPRNDLNTRILFDLANGRSKAITLPMETLRAFEWNTGQKLTLTVDEKKKRITIEAKKA